MPENEKPKPKIDLNRREMPKQEEHIRSHNFFEVALGYTAELAIEEAQRCLQCKKPFCVADCPVNIKIPEFIHALRRVTSNSKPHSHERNSLLRSAYMPQNIETPCIVSMRTIAIGRLER
jgi:glutamate synthase (NADPH/NADH) small chain